MQSTVGNAVTRRVALAGLGASGLAAGAMVRGRKVAAQDVSSDAGAHPIVGLWQGNTADPGETPDWSFEIFHADGTFIIWAGLGGGAGLGIWRSTGDRTADLILIWRDTDPSTATEGPGTATFRMTLEVSEDGTTLSIPTDNLDIRDAYGTVQLNFDLPLGNSNRVTFDSNPATGSTVTEAPPPATPIS